MALETNRVKCPRCGHINPSGLKKCEICDAPLAVVKMEAAPPAASPGAAKDQMKQIFFRRGQIVAGRYTVMDMIGRGGMGCIYKVYDNTLKEEVALKTLLPQFARDKLVVERFYNEARIARALSHEGIVRVHDIGLDGDMLYISMAFLKGKSLRAIMDAQPPGTLLPVTQVLRIFDALCAALDYAHNYTVHRDIKPENVMIGSNGDVKLMDFGISKLVTHTSMTATSVVMGTPHYMSPEQLKDSANVDGRADVYSVGVMLYEITTGNVPTGVPKPASQIHNEVPHKIDEIIAKCLEPDPKDRYQSAAELRKELRDAYDMITGVAAQVDTSLDALKTKRETKPAASSNALRMAAGLVLIAVIAGGALFGFSAVEARWQTAAETMGEFVAPDVDTIASEDGQVPWARVESLVNRARAASLRGSVPNKESIIDAGDSNWEAAREAWEGGASDVAYAFALDALQCFVAPRLLAEYSDMVFVWPGDVVLRDGPNEATVRVAGFLIDKHEVTVSEYVDFCEKVTGGWPMRQGVLTRDGDTPITDITFYDALACASFYGKTIPTEAEWARAAYGEPMEDAPNDLFPWGAEYEKGNANCADHNNVSLQPPGEYNKDKSRTFEIYDVIGNAAEWTSSEFEPLTRMSSTGNALDLSKPAFDVQMTVRGGSIEQQGMPLNIRMPFHYTAHYHTVGFRCALPLPRDFNALETLIGS